MESEEVVCLKEKKIDDVNRETYAVIDGLNVAFSRNDGVARLSDLIAVAKTISGKFSKYETIVDASARHRIDNKVELEHHIENGKITLCPAGIDGDDLIWSRAKSLYEKGFKVSIISNDMFPVRRRKEESIPIDI